jgi:hypothetical protein
MYYHSHSPFLLSGLSRHNISSSIPQTPPFEGVVVNVGDPLPEANRFYMYLSSIHSSSFFEELMKIVNWLLQGVSGGKFNLMIEAVLDGNRFRTVGKSFIITSGTTLSELESFLNPYIESFEAQSGGGESGPQTFESRLRIVNISSAPNPEQIPFTSDPANVQWSKDVKAETKARRRPAPTLSAINSGFETMNSKLESLNKGFEQLANVLQSQPKVTQPVAQPSIISGVDWTPIVQSVIAGIGTAFGAQVSFSQSASKVATPLEKSAPLTSSPQSPINLTKIEARLDNLENNLNSVQTSLHSVTQNLSSQIENLAKSQVQTNSQVSSLAQALETFIKAQTPSKSSNSNDSNGGAVNSSTIEQIKNPPLNLPEITTLQESNKSINFNKRIVTADLESMIEPTTGENLVYMASWYNGETYNTFDVSQFGYDSGRMLRYYWEDLIKANRGKICYFHNWGGYDSILSLTQLLNLPKNYAFNPVMKDGEMMSLTITQGTVTILTIKDSIKVMPGSLSKLAKDWKVETLKDHFPHYFYLNDIKSTLLYNGPIPEYTCFEPKRTSLAEYNEMVELFKNKIGLSMVK